MALYLDAIGEIEHVLKKCNNNTYIKICNIIEYIVKNYKGIKDGTFEDKKNILKKNKTRNNDTNSKKDKANDMMNNSIRNYFKVVKKSNEINDNNNKINNITTTDGVDALNDKNSLVDKQIMPLINIFFFFGNFNIIIIIYYIIQKINLFNNSMFISDSSEKNMTIGNSINTNASKDYILYDNKNMTHIMCSQLKNNNHINDILKKILSYNFNSFKIFILESFDSLSEQNKKIFMNKIIKNKNLIFIHSSVYINSVYINNCLYVRVPRPDKVHFNLHILSILKSKYDINIYDDIEKKEYLFTILNNCNYDLTQILTIIYFIKINDFPDINKVNKLIINSNIKKLINTIHNLSISNNSLNVIRNILYTILYTYNFNIHTFLNLFCKQLVAYHRNDNNYKKELYTLFSEYSYYCILHDNHICSLENMTTQIILLEQKYVHTLDKYVLT
ncbi:conserved protein, unknown function [Hepatocystis sp. ex Piliocolobus tephrosceles]|nr:conserved protein, unknown function [Hepatocystis sp. ex Piliocolobus tephrosceles]